VSGLTPAFALFARLHIAKITGRTGSIVTSTVAILPLPAMPAAAGMENAVQGTRHNDNKYLSRGFIDANASTSASRLVLACGRIF